jgi:hypothetical protein
VCGRCIRSIIKGDRHGLVSCGRRIRSRRLIAAVGRNSGGRAVSPREDALIGAGARAGQSYGGWIKISASCNWLGRRRIWRRRRLAGGDGGVRGRAARGHVGGARGTNQVAVRHGGWRGHRGVDALIPCRMEGRRILHLSLRKVAADDVVGRVDQSLEDKQEVVKVRLVYKSTVWLGVEVAQDVGTSAMEHEQSLRGDKGGLTLRWYGDDMCRVGWARQRRSCSRSVCQLTRVNSECDCANDHEPLRRMAAARRSNGGGTSRGRPSSARSTGKAMSESARGTRRVANMGIRCCTRKWTASLLWRETSW